MAQLLEYKFDTKRIEEYVRSLIHVDNVKITVQFGSFVNGFSDAVTRSEYNRLLNHYKNAGFDVVTSEHTEIVSAKGRPYFVISRDGKLYSSSKDTLRREDLPELGIRILITTGDEKEAFKRPDPSFNREVTTSTIDTGEYKIIASYSVQRNNPRYAIHIELPFTSIDRLSDIVTEVTGALKGSQLAVTLDQVDRAYLILNDALGGPECIGKICYNLVPQPRNIKISDILGGVIPVKDSPNYYVAPKADGVNAFLVMDRGTYLIHGSIVNKISENAPYKAVIQGELVGNKLFAFDILKVHDEYLRDMVYAERLNKFNQIDLSLIPFEVSLKRTNQITSRNFYLMNQSVLDDEYEFEIDGLIYTPNTQYSVALNRPILKWKPPEQLTIDFTVKDGELYTATEKFRGTPKHPYNPNFNRPDLDGIVGEFEFKRNEDGKIDRFVLIRERPDKPWPNSQKVAESVWLDIASPITTAYMTGQTFNVMIDYIKTIKRRNLLNAIIDVEDEKDEDLQRVRPIIILGENALDPNYTATSEMIKGLNDDLRKLRESRHARGPNVSVILVTENINYDENGEEITLQGAQRVNIDLYASTDNKVDIAYEKLEKLSNSYPDAVIFVDTPALLPLGLEMLKERGHKIIIFAVDGASVFALPQNPMLTIDGEWWTIDVPDLEGTGQIIDYVPLIDELGAKSEPLTFNFLTVSEAQLLTVFRIIQ